MKASWWLQILCLKNHQILPKLAVSQQNKTYVVTLMLRVVVGAVSKKELFSL
jgi:hypothetical protein